jgi:glutathione peroxidase
MRHILILLGASCVVLLGPHPAAGAEAACSDYFDHKLRRLHARDDVNLCEITAGKAVLIINTASHCGYAPQFKGLEALHQRYRERGLVVVGFASDSFRQEADSEAEAADVCYVNYGVSFTMLAPTAVRGPAANPVFKALSARAGEPVWNFNKYLVSADGSEVRHFDSGIKPDSAVLTDAIEEVL